MKDPVFSAFLKKQYEEGLALAGESDLLDLTPLFLPFEKRSGPPSRFVATFHSRGLVLEPGHQVREADLFEVGIFFPGDYLRRIDPALILTLLHPHNVWHPNISLYGPFICAGRMSPGTGLVELLYQVFEILTYQKVTMREDDALNPSACAWARQNQHRFPIDPRPLKRRAIDFEIEAIAEEEKR